MSQDSQPLEVTPKLVVGLFIALLGVVLALDRAGIADLTSILRFWPVAIIGVGLTMAFQSRELSGRVNGVFVALFGTYALLYALRIVHVRFWELFWPFVLIMVGVGLATQALQPRRASTAGDGKERVSLFAVMSGVKRASHASPFRGADMSALMGGGQLDLRQATIPPGEDATIDIYGLMSGFEIFVPSHWRVSTGIVPVHGERRRQAPAAARPGHRPVARDQHPAPGRARVHHDGERGDQELGFRGSGLGARGSGLGARGSGLGTGLD